MVTFAEAPELRKWNFGMRPLQMPVTPHGILNELKRYDATDARLVNDYIRATCTTTSTAQEYRTLHEKVMRMPVLRIKNEANAYHRAMTKKLADFEAAIYWHWKRFRMEPLVASAAAAVQLTDAKVSAPLAHG